MKSISKILATMLIACLMVIIFAVKPASALYINNVPVFFQTSRGSCYIVGKTGLSRLKYDGTNAGGDGKNIFYAFNNSEADQIQTQRDSQQTTYKVEPPVPPGQNYRIVFTSTGTKYIFPLTTNSIQGGVPIDMVLKDDGSPALDDRFHIGDEITNTNMTNMNECASQWIQANTN